MYSTEQLVECLKKCQFQTEDLVAYLSAIKFISLKLTGNELNPDKPTRIRLINNSYYRFGYDHGIAIIFDDDYCRLSVGIHNKSKLSSLGVKYTN